MRVTSTSMINVLQEKCKAIESTLVYNLMKLPKKRKSDKGKEETTLGIKSKPKESR